MNTSYLLPCTCGRNVNINVRQAGGTITCTCGAQLDVPALRQMRDLEEAAYDESQRETPRGRINAFVMGDIIFGTFFIVCGIYSIYFGEDIFLRYVCFSVGTTLLVWAFIKMSLRLGMKCSLCPTCGHNFPRKELRAFTTTWGVRKTRACPVCGTVLIRVKLPWIMLNIALPIFLGLLMLQDIVADNQRQKAFYYLLWALILAAFVITEVALIRLRFEAVEKPESRRS